MSVFGHNKRLALAAAALALGSVAIPASYAHDALLAATMGVASTPLTADQARDAMLAAGTRLAYTIDNDGDETVTASSDQPDEDGEAGQSAALDPELECMAKVVHHEAANQPREGQLAVAQLIMNRIRSGRFPDTICGVANQPGQFFHTASYHPNRSSASWARAIEVSREARNGTAGDVAEGAIFYHAAYQRATAFFRTRPRVMTLGDHIFYR